MIRTIVAGACVVGCLASDLSSQSPAVAIDPITEWGSAASTAATASEMAAFRTPISLALLHVAMYDAVTAAGDRTRGSTSAYAAAVEAGYRILSTEFSSQEPALRTTYERLLAVEPPGPRRQAGIDVGAD